VSGLATKTSAVEFLLSSIFQTFPAHRGSIAAVCFNVKGPDLCFLDQPSEISERDHALYDKLGLAASPLVHARYFAPFKADGVNLNTLRTHEALQHNTERWCGPARGSGLCGSGDESRRQRRQG
jgi:hypothetical protein